MTAAEFSQHLHLATERVLAFTRLLVIDTLPDRVQYLIRPNDSFDVNPLHPDEVVFPEDTIPHGGYREPTDAAGVVEFLWRAGRVPEWIDVRVIRTDAEWTWVELRCSGRFTANDQWLYHKKQACLPPFQILGPKKPREWFLDEQGRRDRRMPLETQLRLHGRFPLPIPDP